MKISALYGYNFPLNWAETDLAYKIKEAIKRQIEFEVITYEPYENDIENLSKADNISQTKVWAEIDK